MLTSRRPLSDFDPRVPDLLMPVPGPLAQELIETDERFTSPSYTRVYPLAVRRGEGAMLEDVDGNKFLDFNAGIAVCATGHCHPKVVEAIREQAGLLLHMSGTDFYNDHNVSSLANWRRLPRVRQRRKCFSETQERKRSRRHSSWLDITRGGRG